MSYFGDTKIARMPIGDVEIAKAYFGDTLVFQKKAASRLPAGYTEVEYISNPSTAYIRTALYGDNTSWTLTAQRTSGSSNAILIGRRTSSGQWFGGLSNGRWGSNTASGAYVAINSTVKSSIALSFGTTNISGTVDGSSFSRNGSASSSGSSYRYSLFSYGGNYPFVGSIFGDVVGVRNNAEIFHGVCCTDPNGVAGLYDLVSETFYDSYNDVALVAGPAI